MFESFEHLPEEKRERIINVCIEEFAEHGYRKASTNEITKKAGISKGILFHYFGNKKNLYLYILDYILNYFNDILTEDLIKIANGDIFEMILDIGFVKLKIYSQFPVECEFIANAFLSPPEEIEGDIKASYNKIYGSNIQVLLQKFDTSKLRKDIDENKAIELLMIILDGISNKYIKLYKGREKEMIENADKIVKDFEEYMHILKVGFYDNE